MIYDCFTFFNELDLLEIRLNVLDEVVDKFVLVEMSTTHTGKDKPLYFNQNKARFAKFEDKIIHIIVDDYPELDHSKNDDYGNKWLLENYQRDAIMEGLKNCHPDDIVIISDLDEFPSPEVVTKYKEEKAEGIWVLEQKMMYYFINNICITDPIWRNGTRMGHYKNLLNPGQNLAPLEFYEFSKQGLPTYFRFCQGTNIINAGWHFSYCGGVEAIIKKRQSIVEQQFNTSQNMSPEYIKEIVSKGLDILDRNNYKYQGVKLDNSFPQYILDNQEKYAHLICDIINYHSKVNEDNDPRRYCIDWIDENSKILDIGCACGDLAKEIKSQKKVDIWGIEYDAKRCEIARKSNHFEDVYQIDLNNFDKEKFENFQKFFDYIIFGDVLEHTLYPQAILNLFKSFLKPDGSILISLPNIAHASIKANLLLNNFDYTDEGLLDRTHVKFFTFKTIAALLANCNLKIMDYKFTDWADKYGTQSNNPYKHLPKRIKHFILSDKHSFVCQYVLKSAISIENNLYLKNYQFIDTNTYIRKTNHIFKKNLLKLLTNIIPIKKWRKKIRTYYKNLS